MSVKKHIHCFYLLIHFCQQLVPLRHILRALHSPKQHIASHHLIPKGHQEQDMDLPLTLLLMPHNSQVIQHSPIPTHSSHQQCTHSKPLDLTTQPLLLVTIHSRHTIPPKAQHMSRVASHRLSMFNSLLSSITVEGTK